MGRLIFSIASALVLATVASVAVLADDHQETVAIIGTGLMGGAIGPRLAEQGYRIVYGSRDPSRDKVRALVERTAGNASAATQKAAAGQASVIVLALPWPAMETVAQNLGDLTGKILIDVSDPIVPDETDGYYRHTLETSAGELIQGWNPGAKVVKAFNTMGYFVIADPSAALGAVTVPILSDDRPAKCKVMKMVAGMGLDPFDAGPLRYSRLLEMMAALYMVPFAHQDYSQSFEFFFRRNDHWQGFVDSLSDEARAEWQSGAPAVAPCI
jgi:predicted dinucleotide-binding enzyme